MVKKDVFFRQVGEMIELRSPVSGLRQKCLFVSVLVDETLNEGDIAGMACWLAQTAGSIDDPSARGKGRSNTVPVLDCATTYKV